MRVTYGRRSVLWRHSDTLCTSGFMDDVMFARKPRLIDVAAKCTRSLGLGYKLCAVIPAAGQRTCETRFLAQTFQVATPGAESAVYDCLVPAALKWIEARETDSHDSRTFACSTTSAAEAPRTRRRRRPNPVFRLYTVSK